VNRPPKKFSPASAFAAFKRIRNRIRRHFPEEIIFACIEKLHCRDKTSIKELTQFPPWYLLLLIKWTILNGDFLSPERRRLSSKDFTYLINLIHDLNGWVRLPSHYDNTFLFFRNVAYQQVWFQEENYPRLARQSLMFGNLNKEHPFRDAFFKKIGLTIEQFIQLATITFSKFLEKDEPFITTDWFKSVRRTFPPNTIDIFLSTICSDIDHLRAFLTEKQKKSRDISYEFHEQTPLKYYPLLNYKDKYYCFSKEVLYHAFQDFIYDTLRSEAPESFMNKFGGIFESYVNKGLLYSGVNFIDEKRLKEKIAADGKIIDFLLIEDDANVFIDAKGVELAHLGMVSHKSEVVQDKTRSSVIKAITQGYETAISLDAMPNTHHLISGKVNYLLVVTYKDLYIGNGQDFYENIAKDKLDRIIQEKGKNWIPFENMYFISIDDFELLIQCAKDRNMGISGLLRKAVKADSTPENKKLIFRDHVYSECENAKIPEYLNEEFDKIFSQIEQRLLTNQLV